MSNLDGIDKALAKAAEDRTRTERALAPNRAIADLVKGMQFSAQVVDFAKIARTMQPSTHLTAVAQMMTAMQREHGRFAEVARPLRIMEELAEQMARMRTVSETITAPYLAIQDMLKSQSAVFEKLSAQSASFAALKLSIPQFSEMTLVWNVASIGLANRMKEIGLLARREMLSARLFEAPNAYSAFVRHTTEQLAAAPAPDIAARLRGSLNLAEQQLLGIADAVSGFIVVPDDEEKPDAVRTLDAPFVQQNELLGQATVRDETDTEALTSISPTAQTVRGGRRVLELVTLCNDASKTSISGVEIFKPTTRLLTVFNDLPWLSPTDRLRFADVVDCLYFIFYEGAGKDNLRFLEKHGGPLTEADCDLIWCIKHLRNKWSRHDADHGKDKDIDKSWAELAAKFRWLGLAEHPKYAHHFQQLHHQLLILAEEFLEKILSKLNLKQ